MHIADAMRKLALSHGNAFCPDCGHLLGSHHRSVNGAYRCKILGCACEQVQVLGDLHRYSRSCDCVACDGERRTMQDGAECYEPQPE